MIAIIEVPIAEVVDKITILNIKLKKIKVHKSEIKKDLARLKKSIRKLEIPIEVTAELQNVNSQLWDLENSVRMHERMFLFDDDFINDCRQIFKLNDRRAEIKKEINKFTGSDIVEFKSHK